MAAYLLNCDEAEARDLWLEWLTTVRPWRLRVLGDRRMASPKVRIEPANGGNAYFSLQLVAELPTKLIAFTAVALGLSLWFATSLLSFAFGRLGLDPMAATVLGAVGNVLTTALAFSPLVVLGGLSAWLGRSEARYLDFLSARGVSSQPLSARRHWVLFPGDAVVAQGIVLIFSLLAFSLTSRNGSLLLVFLPWLLMIASYSTLALLSELFLHRLGAALVPYTYWRLRAAQLTTSVAAPFLLVLLMYSGLSFAQHGVLAVRYGYTQGLSGGTPTSVVEQTENLRTIQRFDTREFVSGLDRAELEDTTQIAVDYLKGEVPNARYMGPIFGLTMLLILLLVAGYIVRALRTWQREWDDYPHHVPMVTQTEGSSPLPNVLVVAHWLVLVIGNFMSLSVALIALAWVLEVHPPLPLTFTAPFVWYEVAMSEVGGRAGPLLARLSVSLIIAPCLGWTAVSLGQMVVTAARSGALAMRSKTDSTLHSILTGVSEKAGVRTPRVEMVPGVRWPETQPVNPLFGLGVVRLSEPLTDVLSDRQLEHVLAHEIGHVRLHLRRIWALQWLSHLSLCGPGYLTLLSDYLEMELEADDFAVELTNDRDGFAETLAMVPALFLRAQEAFSGNESVVESRPARQRSVWTPVVEPYRLYFGSALWGYLHPAVNARLQRLEGASDPSSDAANAGDQVDGEIVGERQVAPWSPGAADAKPPPKPAPTLAPFSSGFAAVRDRLLAYTVDAAVYLGLFVLAGVPFAIVQGGTLEEDAVGTAIFTLIALALPFCYLTVCWRLWGRTLGFLVFGLLLRRGEEGRPTTLRALLRSIALVLEIATVVGLFLPLVDRKRRELADVIAGTTMAKEVPAASPSLAPATWGFSSPAGAVLYRAGGYGIDAALLFCLVVLPIALVWGLLYANSGETANGAAGPVMLLGVPLVYLTVSWHVWGRTVGFRLLGLHVHGDDFARLSWVRAFVRAVALLVELTTIAGLFFPFLDKYRREAADRVAGSVVSTEFGELGEGFPPMTNHLRHMLGSAIWKARRTGLLVGSAELLASLDAGSSCSARRALWTLGVFVPDRRLRPSPADVRSITAGLPFDLVSPALRDALAEAADEATKQSTGPLDCTDVVRVLLRAPADERLDVLPEQLNEETLDLALAVVR